MRGATRRFEAAAEAEWRGHLFVVDELTLLQRLERKRLLLGLRLVLVDVLHEAHAAEKSGYYLPATGLRLQIRTATSTVAPCRRQTRSVPRRR